MDSRLVSPCLLKPLPSERFPQALSPPPSPLALLCWDWPTGRISGSIGLASFWAPPSQRFSFSWLIREDCTCRPQPPTIERRSKLTNLSALCNACLAARHV